MSSYYFVSHSPARGCGTAKLWGSRAFIGIIWFDRLLASTNRIIMKAEHCCNNDNRVVKFDAQRYSEHPESLLQHTESLFNTSSCPDTRPIVPLFTWRFWCTRRYLRRAYPASPRRTPSYFPCSNSSRKTLLRNMRLSWVLPSQRDTTFVIHLLASQTAWTFRENQPFLFR